MPIKDWKHKWARLRSMSPEELQCRLRQQIGARSDALRCYAGLEFPVHLGSATATGRFFFDTGQVGELCRALQDRMPQQAESVIARAEKICRHRFDLLGYCDLDYGSEIDWHLDVIHGKRAPRKPFHQVRYLDFDEVGDSKVTWELSRHQHLVTLAKAYRFTGDTKFTSELFAQWGHWQRQNPYPTGTNWASSLEVAFRSLSWLWVYFLLADAPVLPQWFPEQWIKAQALSGRHLERYLSTYFSPNTHLLGEGVALFFLGTLCPQIREASRWQERGWDIILNESRRQVRPDGFHFEQSLYYHVYALDFFLHARTLAARNGVTIPAEFDSTLENMLGALALFAGSGAPPSVGDDDGGRLFDPQRNRTPHLLDPLATGAVLFRRGEFKALAGDIREETVWLLGVQAVEEFDRLAARQPALASAALPDSGFYIMADSGLRTQLLLDAGPQGTVTAGHGHADALSICIAHAGQPLLIDPGTCEYVGDGPERNEFRGTAAHNTLRVDNSDQAVPAGPFAWKNLPEVVADQWIAGEKFTFFAGHHDGYSRLPRPVIHRRDVFALKEKFWFVRDRAQGDGAHTLELSWHFPPDFHQQDGWLVSPAGAGIAVVAAEGHGWNARLEPGFWSPAYGRKEAAPVLRFSASVQLPHTFATMLVPRLARAQEVGSLERLQAQNACIDGYRYRTSREEYFIVFNDDKHPWTLGPCASDAELLCFGIHHDGRRELIFCNGRQVKIAGNPVVCSAELVQRCELLYDGAGTRMFSSVPGGIALQESLGDIALEKAGTTAE